MKENPGHDATAAFARRCYTVTEIAEAIRQNLESEFPGVSVVGEVANCKYHQSGHVYFTLRDAESMLSAALFRRAAERAVVRPEDGMSVVVTGRLSHFGAAGRTQIIVSELAIAGRGEMERAFRALLERLRAEGLTAVERKRSICPYPRAIAVITSPTGAVIKDIVDALRRRWPIAEIVHVPADVQGPAAAPSIVRAFARCNEMPEIDAVILARGGGSAEDLWTFNLEAVARAVAGSRHPVVTGIGHEIDTTICDYVSDMRAATPTAAAELVSPRIEEVERGLDESLRRIGARATGSLVNKRQLVDYLERSAALAAIEHRVERAARELDDCEDRIAAHWSETLGGRREELVAMMGEMEISLERRRARAEAGRLRALASLAVWNPRTRIGGARAELVNAARLMRSRIASGVSERRAASTGLMNELAGLDPRGVLRRGYAYCTTADGARIISRAESLANGDDLLVRFFDGAARCRVEEKRKGTPWRKK